MEKRGLSSIVVAVLIILFVLVSIFLVWRPVSDSLSNLDSVNTDKFSTSLEIFEGSVIVDENNSLLFITIYRPTGTGNITGVIVSVDYDSGESETTRVPLAVGELETKIINVSYTPSKGNLTKVSIAPIFDNNGVEDIGFVTDEYDFGRGGGGGGGGSGNDNGDGGGGTPQCSDGEDNDGDGLIDLDDPGCTTSDDDDESDEDNYYGEFIVLSEGDGFNGLTNDPDPVGSSGDEGYDAKAIGRWDVVPFQSIDDRFYVGVLAFHMNGIEKVEFSLNGGNWAEVNATQFNPSSGVEEYTVIVDPVNSSAEILEVRAIIWPNNAGQPRVLDGNFNYDLKDNGEDSLFLFNKNFVLNDNTTLYVSLLGDDNNPGTEGAPLKTIAKALDIFKTSYPLTNSSGEIILLDEGLYEGPYRNAGHLYYNNSNWITVRPNIGVNGDNIVISRPSWSSILPQVKMLKWEDVNFDFVNISQYYQAKGEEISWFEGTSFYDSSGWDGNLNRLAPVRSQYFVINGDSSEILYAFPNAMLLRDVTMSKISGDVFQNSLMIVGAELNTLMNRSEHHTDMYQMFGSMDNLIVYDVVARNITNAQSIFLEPTYSTDFNDPRYALSNAAFVDVEVYNTPVYRNNVSFGTPPASQMMSLFDHVIFENLILPNQRMILRDDIGQGDHNQWWEARNVIFRNSRLHWATYDAYCQGSSPDGTVFENCVRSDGEEE